MELIEIVEGVIGLLLIAGLVAIVTNHFRMPYTVGLVIVGLGIALSLDTLLPEQEQIEYIRSLIAPQIILGILVPPLIFEAALHIQFEDLKKNLKLILIFAIPGVAITMFLVGGLISRVTPLPLEAALLFGALISATDPVAVVALFKTMGVPKRLRILLEGESLFNDGIAIVAYSIMIGVVTRGETINGVTLITDFLWIAGGGLVVGAAVAWISSAIIRLIDDHLIIITITTVTAYGSYLIAENYHVSGVLAVVAAGLLSGNVGLTRISPTTNISLFNFWEYGAFLANSFTFLLIGLVIDLQKIFENIVPILLAIIIVLAARAVVIYGFSYLNQKQMINLRSVFVLYWGGLRGAISLALALSLPASLGQNQVLMQEMAFGVVLFTLIIQGTTMEPVVKRLGLTQNSPAQIAYQSRQARSVAARASYNRLKSMYEEGLISVNAWETMKQPMQRQMDAHASSVREIMHLNRKVEIAELQNAYEEGLRAQRTMYSSLLSNGIINEDIFTNLVEEIDHALINHEFSHNTLLPVRTNDQPPITKIIIAVIHEDDIPEAIVLLNILGVSTTMMENCTDPNGKTYTTILLGAEQDQEDEVVSALLSICAKHMHLDHDLDGHLPVPILTQIAIEGSIIHESHGGILIYVLDAEHYEEF